MACVCYRSNVCLPENSGFSSKISCIYTVAMKSKFFEKIKCFIWAGKIKITVGKFDESSSIFVVPWRHIYSFGNCSNITTVFHTWSKTRNLFPFEPNFCWDMCWVFYEIATLSKLQEYFISPTHRAGARTLIGGVYIHIFRLCPTSFFCIKVDFKRN